MAKPAKKGRGTAIAALVVLIILAGAVGAFYLLNSTKPSGSGTQTVTVDMPNGTGSNTASNYSPHTFTLVIGVNNTVNFVNQDSTTHTVTVNDQSFDSGNIAAGSTWTHTFSTPGTYSFHCRYHTWMAGTVVVKSA